MHHEIYTQSKQGDYIVQKSIVLIKQKKTPLNTSILEVYLFAFATDCFMKGPVDWRENVFLAVIISWSEL